jgi:hypothetical protein
LLGVTQSKSGARPNLIRQASTKSSIFAGAVQNRPAGAAYEFLQYAQTQPHAEAT